MVNIHSNLSSVEKIVLLLQENCKGFWTTWPVRFLFPQLHARCTWPLNPLLVDVEICTHGNFFSQKNKRLAIFYCNNWQARPGSQHDTVYDKGAGRAATCPCRWLLTFYLRHNHHHDYLLQCVVLEASWGSSPLYWQYFPMASSILGWVLQILHKLHEWALWAPLHLDPNFYLPHAENNETYQFNGF